MPVSDVPVTLVTPVPLSWGLLFAEVIEYTTPTAVRLAPPVAVTLPPSVTLVEATLALVGLVTVGGVSRAIANVPKVELQPVVPVW